MRWFLLIYLIIWLLDPRTAAHLYTMNNFALFKAWFLFLFIMNIELLTWMIVDVIKSTREIMQRKEVLDVPDEEEMPTVDWCRLDELAALLLWSNGLPVREFRRIFNKSNEAHKKLGDNLERIGLLIRWENNARVLATKDKDVIIDALMQSSDSDDLPTPLVREQGTTTVRLLSPKTAVQTA